MKKIIIIITVLTIISISATLKFSVRANDNNVIETNNFIENKTDCCKNLGEFKAQTRVNNVNTSINLAEGAKSSYLIDVNSKTVVFASNENARLPIASMTKLMLILLTLEQEYNGSFSLSENITVSENASGMGGSQVFLQANKEYLASDLLKSVIIASANDASVALAERLYGSEEEAVCAMNNKAQLLNMTNTLFSNCTGLPKLNQYSSAKDVAIMLNEVIKYDKYFEYSGIWLDTLKHPDGSETTLTNTNKLVKYFDGCDGGKTGYTDLSRFCLAATCKRGNMRLISVVIGEENSKERFKDVSNMFNYGFNNFVSKTIVDASRPMENEIEISKGKQKTIEVIPQSNYSAFQRKNENIKYDFTFTPNDKIVAPINKGDSVGLITIYANGVEIATVKVLANETILRKNFFDGIREILLKWAI